MNKPATFFLVVILLIPTAPCRAASVDAATKTRVNTLIRGMFNEMFALKDNPQHEELRDLTPAALTVNDHGFGEINYQTEVRDISGRSRTYAVGLTAVPLNEDHFSDHGRHIFVRPYPLLNLRLIGYERRPFGDQYSIRRALEEKEEGLLTFQQEYLPVEMKLKTEKEAFRVGEPIAVEVSLKNVSSQNLLVKEMSAKTLYFEFKNRMWGAREIHPKTRGTRLLEPGEEIRETFHGPAFRSPQVFEIFCMYAVSFDGVKPQSTIKVRVVE